MDNAMPGFPDSPPAAAAALLIVAAAAAFLAAFARLQARRIWLLPPPANDNEAGFRPHQRRLHLV